jgi:DNA replication protein DnaC
MTEVEQLQTNLKRLSLKRMAAIFMTEADRAATLGTTYTGYLERLVAEELIGANERSVNHRLKQARFPGVRTLDSFDFRFQPTVNEALIRELAELGFLSARANVILLGPPGVGKTHLAIGLGVKACAARKRVRCYTALELMDELMAAAATRQLSVLLERLSRMELLIIDELGYLVWDKPRANLFFQLVNRCYERVSIIITSNRSFDQWGEAIGDETIASAILDRLVHHSHIIAIQGESYRLRDRRPKKVDNRIQNQENEPAVTG